MAKLIILTILTGALLGCSTSNNQDKDSELLTELKSAEWVSNVCESHNGHPWTTHSFTVSESNLVFTYKDYGPDCVDQFAEFVEVRPFTLGGRITTEEGLEATEIDIYTEVVPPERQFMYIKDLITVQAGVLYFGVTGRDMGCESGNVLIDVDGGFGGYIPDIYVCDQRPVQLDFDNGYTKRI